MIRRCPKCGSTRRKSIYWDGYMCGGHKTECCDCGLVLEDVRYEASGKVSE